MKTKYIYIIPSWYVNTVSESKGVVICIASNDEECVDILTPHGDIADYYPGPTLDWIKNNSKKFKLADTDLDSQIVEQFLFD